MADQRGKKQVMLSMDQADLDRVDALRIVMGVSRGSTLRTMVTDALPIREEQYQERLLRLAQLAGRSGVSLERFVRDYAERNAQRTYGETLEELEEKAGITPVSV